MSFVFCLRDCESSQENYNYLIALGPSAESGALNLYFTTPQNVAIFLLKVYDYDRECSTFWYIYQIIMIYLERIWTYMDPESMPKIFWLSYLPQLKQCLVLFNSIYFKRPNHKQQLSICVLWDPFERKDMFTFRGDCSTLNLELLTHIQRQCYDCSVDFLLITRLICYLGSSS